MLWNKNWRKNTKNYVVTNVGVKKLVEKYKFRVNFRVKK